MSEESENRPEYHATEVSLMSCNPANFDGSDGEEAVVFFIARTDLSIEPMVMSQSDARDLVTKVLVALATERDEFAGKLLDDHFASDELGEFRWPNRPYGTWL